MTTTIDLIETINKVPHSAQIEFDKTYISSAAIIEELGLNRASLRYARKTGKLPEPIVVTDGHIYLWLRSEVEPYIKAWRMVIDARRNGV